jgi:hypothetical protein
VRFIFVSSLLLKSITRIATAVAERGGGGARRHGGASVLWLRIWEEGYDRQ